MSNGRTTQNPQNPQKPIWFAFSALSALIVLACAASAAAQPNFPTAIPQTKFNSGQDIVPYFEGWIRNKDGSFDLVFGYFNRNWEEEIAIAPGPDNLIEPGGPDRGQPTYFLPRRQGWVFRVRVPRDFGKQAITWSITAHGRTEKAYGELLPVEEITERIIQTRGNLNSGDDDPNKPPVVTIAPVQNAAVNAAVPLVASVADDGLPKPRTVVTRPQTVSADGTIRAQANSSGGGPRRGLNVTWMQIHGPAKARIEPAGPIMVANGAAPASVKFSAPGTYVLRATANDGALATKSDVTIAVAGGASAAVSGVGRTDGASGAPLIDNARVSVWKVESAAPQPAGDAVWISLDRLGEASFHASGSPAGMPATGRGVVIEVKDARVPPLENKSGYPPAFPRPGVKKLLENDRVIVWDYTWTTGVATPMHFHDKDVVVTYIETGALKSTTPNGQSSANEFAFGDVRYNARDRVHTELLVSPRARAIITELK